MYTRKLAWTIGIVVSVVAAQDPTPTTKSISTSYEVTPWGTATPYPTGIGLWWVGERKTQSPPWTQSCCTANSCCVGPCCRSPTIWTRTNPLVTRTLLAINHAYGAGGNVIGTHTELTTIVHVRHASKTTHMPAPTAPAPERCSGDWPRGPAIVEDERCVNMGRTGGGQTTCNGQCDFVDGAFECPIWPVNSTRAMYDGEGTWIGSSGRACWRHQLNPGQYWFLSEPCEIGDPYSKCFISEKK